MNLEELEKALKQQHENGWITEKEMHRILKRTTGGVYLTPQQKVDFERAETFINRTVNLLFGLGVITEKRVEITQKKLVKGISAHISQGGKITKEGQPIMEE